MRKVAILLTLTMLLGSLAGCLTAEEPPSPTLTVYGFDGTDAVDTASSSTDDDLVDILMTQGADTNWTDIEITMSVDNGAPMECKDSATPPPINHCTYDTDSDQYWDVGDEITITETSDKCNSPCKIIVRIQLKSIDDDADKVIGNVEVQVS